MGYDSGECISCYCRYGGNNLSNVIQMTICNVCFMKQCPDGLHGRACCSSYVRISKSHCDVCCNRGVPCLTRVAVCLRCVKEFDPICDISKRHVYNQDRKNIDESSPDSDKGKDDDDLDYAHYRSFMDTFCPYDNTLECDGSCGCVNCSAWQENAVDLFMPSS